MRVPKELDTIQRFFYLRGFRSGKFQIHAAAVFPTNCQLGHRQELIAATGDGLTDEEHDKADEELLQLVSFELLAEQSRKAERTKRDTWIISTGICQVKGCDDGDLIVVMRSFDGKDRTRAARSVWRKRHKLWQLWYTRCRNQ